MDLGDLGSDGTRAMRVSGLSQRAEGGKVGTDAISEIANAVARSLCQSLDRVAFFIPSRIDQ